MKLSCASRELEPPIGPWPASKRHIASEIPLAVEVEFHSGDAEHCTHNLGCHSFLFGHLVLVFSVLAVLASSSEIASVSPQSPRLANDLWEIETLHTRLMRCIQGRNLGGINRNHWDPRLTKHFRLNQRSFSRIRSVLEVRRFPTKDPHNLVPRAISVKEPQPSKRLIQGIKKQLDTSSKAFRLCFKRQNRKLFQSYGNSEASGQPLNSSGQTKMKSHIQFLTTPTADTPGTALLLHFNEKRYLFGNIHEGLQRAGIESGAKFSKVTDIFVTGKTEWKSTGGLFGLILTLADAATEATKAVNEMMKQKQERLRKRLEQGQGDSTSTTEASIQDAFRVTKPTLNIHGGPNLTHLFATARSFIFRKSIPVKVFEHETNGEEAIVEERKPDWADDCIQAWTLAITPTRSDEEAGSRPGSRKRSHTEYSESSFPANLFLTDASPKGDKQADQDLRKHAVCEMFESSWRLDQFEEHPLSEVPAGAMTFIRNPETNKLERYQIPRMYSGTSLPDINVFARKPWPGSLIEELPTSKPSTVALSYIVRNHYQRGKFLPAKAKELNVQCGPLFSKLAAGENVESLDGKTVTPNMVLAEGKEGGGVAIIDLPDVDYVENLVQRPEWQAVNIMNGVGGFLWLLGPGVAEDPRLQDFIRSRNTLQHIISSPDDCSNHLVFSSSAAAAIRLSQVDSRYFPIPIHSNSLSSTAFFQEPYLTLARPGQTLQLEPKVEKQNGAILPILDTAKVLQNTSKKVLSLAREARAEIEQAVEAKTSTSQSLSGEDAEITCLGTGSASPSKYRNVAGTLLRVPGYGSYLLDCGENTLGQLKRVYDPAALKDILRSLKLIWISHLHADHHLGTAAVIKAWYEEVHGSSDGPSTSDLSILDEFTQPEKVFTGAGKLCVVGGIQMTKWLKEYASVEDYGYSKILPFASRTTDDGKGHSFLEWNGQRFRMVPGFGDSISQALRLATGLIDLQACRVSHCWDAQAVALTFPTGFKVSYSGDCRPSKTFADIGKNSTVLIHEATFDDELKGDAEAKRHSTTSEAIGVGLAMRARTVVLTHFSQRYQKIPVMESVEAGTVTLEDADDEDLDVPIAEEGTAEASKNDPAPEIGVEQTAAVEEAPRKEGSMHASQDIDGTGIGNDPPQKPASTREGEKPSSVAKDMKVCVAFDYMKIRVGDIEHMEKLTPALVELYQSTYHEDEIDKEDVGSAEAEASEATKPGKAKKSNEEVNRGKSRSDKAIARKEKEMENPARLDPKAPEAEVPVQAPQEANTFGAGPPTEHSSVTDLIGDPQEFSGSVRFLARNCITADDDKYQRRTRLTPVSSLTTNQARPPRRLDHDDEQRDSYEDSGSSDSVRFLDGKFVPSDSINNQHKRNVAGTRSRMRDQARPPKRLNHTEKTSGKTDQVHTWESLSNEGEIPGKTGQVHHLERLESKEEILGMTRNLCVMFPHQQKLMTMLREAIEQGDVPDEFIPMISTVLRDIRSSFNKLEMVVRRWELFNLLKAIIIERGYYQISLRARKEVEKLPEARHTVVRFSGQPPYTSRSTGRHRREES